MRSLGKVKQTASFLAMEKHKVCFLVETDRETEKAFSIS